MHGLLLLLLQIGSILVLARLVGRLMRRIHQPQVVGEMIAGILLGPSLFGAVAPAAYAALFPPESFEALQTLSQIGLLFFMFLVGLELEPTILRDNLRTAFITSQVSILVPFALGVWLAWHLHPLVVGPTVPFLGFACFMGAAMSVTAFPVLSRILTERNLIRTRLGTVTLASAAVDDVTAWFILAGVVALVRSTGAQELLFTLGGTAVFVVLLLLVGRPLLHRLEAYYHSRGRVTQDLLAVVLLALLASAYVTEWLGVHALFGAFLVGTVMPKDRGFVRETTDKLEDVTVVLLLPLFFAFTGLRTQVGLVQGWEAWLTCGLVLLVAVAGKFGGSTLAARATGLSWREASALGVLMNTRGLMELVILSIGLELGVIPPLLFTMMVLMALFTTFMTTPLLAWIYPVRLFEPAEAAEEGAPEKGYTVLLPVSLPSSGPELLRVAGALAPSDRTRFYGLHLLLAREQNFFGGQTSPAPHDPLEPLQEAADAQGIALRPLRYFSRDPGADLVATAAAKGADLIVMGWHKPVLGRSVLGGTVAQVMRDAPADVVVYAARNPGPWRRILVPFRKGVYDQGALEMARRIAEHSEAVLTILHVVAPDDPRQNGSLDLLQTPGAGDARVRIELKLVRHPDPIEAAVAEALQGYDLVVAGADEAWGLQPTPFGLRHERLAAGCTASLLIVRTRRAPGNRFFRLLRRRMTVPAAAPAASDRG